MTSNFLDEIPEAPEEVLKDRIMDSATRTLMLWSFALSAKNLSAEARGAFIQNSCNTAVAAALGAGEEDEDLVERLAKEVENHLATVVEEMATKLKN